MEYEYFLWLVDFIDPDHVVEKSYQPVLYKLYLKDFTCPRGYLDDENRAVDGLSLRYEFRDEGLMDVFSEGFFDRPCSCLEMLIAFSRRLECEILACPGEQNVPRLFWFFIENLGIGPMEDGLFEPGFVEKKIDLWLKRVPISRGGVSIFGDFRGDSSKNIGPIWLQMRDFLNKNPEFR